MIKNKRRDVALIYRCKELDLKDFKFVKNFNSFLFCLSSFVFYRYTGKRNRVVSSFIGALALQFYSFTSLNLALMSTVYIKEIWLSRDLKFLYINYLAGNVTDKVQISKMLGIQDQDFLKKYIEQKYIQFYPVFFKKGADVEIAYINCEIKEGVNFVH